MTDEETSKPGMVYDKTDLAGEYEQVEIPGEQVYPTDNPGVEQMHIREVPVHVAGRLKEAHQMGRLAESLRHYAGALEVCADSTCTDTLKALAGEVRDNFHANGEVLKKAVVALNRLKVTRRA
ncbi:MAG: hypothetical protein JXR49_19370 [Acidobacteria bacterium]|nr:hypothetical protein [Acidobacteriota bacterium]